MRLRQASPREAAAVFHEKGVRLFNNDEKAAALATFEQVLEIDPDHPHGHYMLGLCYLNTGDIARAKTLLQRFLELRPDHPDAPTAREMLESL